MSEQNIMNQYTHSSSEHSMMNQHANSIPSYPANNLSSLNADMPVVNNNIHAQSACHNHGMPALFANSLLPRKPDIMPVHTNKTHTQSAYLYHDMLSQNPGCNMPDDYNNVYTGSVYFNQPDQLNIPAQLAIQAQPTNCIPTQSLYEDIEDFCPLSLLTVRIKRYRF